MSRRRAQTALTADNIGDLVHELEAHNHALRGLPHVFAGQQFIASLRSGSPGRVRPVVDKTGGKPVTRWPFSNRPAPASAQPLTRGAGSPARMRLMTRRGSEPDPLPPNAVISLYEAAVIEQLQRGSLDFNSQPDDEYIAAVHEPRRIAREAVREPVNADGVDSPAAKSQHSPGSAVERLEQGYSYHMSPEQLQRALRPSPDSRVARSIAPVQGRTPPSGISPRTETATRNGSTRRTSTGPLLAADSDGVTGSNSPAPPPPLTSPPPLGRGAEVNALQRPEANRRGSHGVFGHQQHQAVASAPIDRLASPAQQPHDRPKLERRTNANKEQTEFPPHGSQRQSQQPPPPASVEVQTHLSSPPARPARVIKPASPLDRMLNQELLHNVVYAAPQLPAQPTVSIPAAVVEPVDPWDRRPAQHRPLLHVRPTLEAQRALGPSGEPNAQSAKSGLGKLPESSLPAQYGSQFAELPLYEPAVSGENNAGLGKANAQAALKVGLAPYTDEQDDSSATVDQPLQTAAYKLSQQQPGPSPSPRNSWRGKPVVGSSIPAAPNNFGDGSTVDASMPLPEWVVRARAQSSPPLTWADGPGAAKPNPRLAFAMHAFMGDPDGAWDAEEAGRDRVQSRVAAEDYSHDATSDYSHFNTNRQESARPVSVRELITSADTAPPQQADASAARLRQRQRPPSPPDPPFVLVQSEARQGQSQPQQDPTTAAVVQAAREAAALRRKAAGWHSPPKAGSVSSHPRPSLNVVQQPRSGDSVHDGLSSYHSAARSRSDSTADMFRPRRQSANDHGSGAPPFANSNSSNVIQHTWIEGTPAAMPPHLPSNQLIHNALLSLENSLYDDDLPVPEAYVGVADDVIHSAPTAMTRAPYQDAPNTVEPIARAPSVATRAPVPAVELTGEAEETATSSPEQLAGFERFGSGNLGTASQANAYGAAAGGDAPAKSYMLQWRSTTGRADSVNLVSAAAPPVSFPLIRAAAGETASSVTRYLDAMQMLLTSPKRLVAATVMRSQSQQDAISNFHGDERRSADDDGRDDSGFHAQISDEMRAVLLAQAEMDMERQARN